jgi:cytochrome c oxidase subunit 2
MSAAPSRRLIQRLRRSLRPVALTCWAGLLPVVSGAASLEVCQVCHGVRGEGNPALHAPALAGQQRGYLERQLTNFRTGRRGADPLDVNGAVMRAQAWALDTGNFAALAAAFSSLPVVPAPSGGGDAARGKIRYQAECAACHGLRGEGYAQLGTPDLRILDAGYIAAQLEAFRRGWRGATVDDGARDQHGEWMRAVAATIGDPRDPDDIQAFLAEQR